MNAKKYSLIGRAAHRPKVPRGGRTMQHRSRTAVLSSLVAIVLGVTLTSPASAHDPSNGVYEASVRLTTLTPSAAIAKVRFTGEFKQIDQMCFYFTFAANDAFGPGDELELNVAPNQNLGSVGALGGDSDVTAIGLCLVDGYHDAMLAGFYDGAQSITIIDASGSFTVDRLEIIATGKQRHQPHGRA